MMTSFGDVEGASGIVLVIEEAEEEREEEESVFRRRLYEGCELIRRFSMEEMGMFSHRVSRARVLGVGEGLLLQVMYLISLLDLGRLQCYIGVFVDLKFKEEVDLWEKI